MDTEELPPGWAWATLGDVCNVFDNEREPIKREDRDRRCEGKDRSSLFPYYGATGRAGWIDAYRSQGDAILLGEDGAPFLDRDKAKAYRVTGRYWVNNHAHILRPRDPRMMDFLLHQLNYIDYSQLVSGTTRLKLTMDALRRIPLVIPPVTEAERIGREVTALLGQTEEAEAALTRAREGVEQFRASLLHAACTGALTAAWREANPPTETGADLLRRILAERRATWERTEHARLTAKGTPPKGDAWKARYVEPIDPDTSDLPTLPSEWAWATVDQLTDFRGNGLSRAPDGEAEDVPILRISAVRPLRVNLAERRFYKPERGERLDGATAEDGDLLFTRYSGSEQYVGVCGRLRSGGPILYPDKIMCARLAPQFARIAPYLELALNAGASRKHISANIRTTAGQKGIAGSSVKACPIPLPPLAEIAEISATFGDLLDAAEGPVLEQSSALPSLRQSILHAAFTGRLVPQDPADEPAAALLARLRAAPPPARRTRSAQRGLRI